MEIPTPPWVNVVVRYCPHCRLTFPPGTELCKRCHRPLVDQVRREKVEKQ